MALFVLHAVMLAGVAASLPSGVDENTDPLTLTRSLQQPLSSECATNLAELLLLRQELKLAEAVEVGRESLSGLNNIGAYLREIRDALTQKDAPQEDGPKQCTGGFRLVAGKCMLLLLNERKTWADSRLHCQQIGADLATFHDAGTFGAILDYVKEISGPDKGVNVWVGGSDAVVEDVWTWLTGEFMPRGSPFWGTRNNYTPEPSGGTNENCSILYKTDFYYLHDITCSHAGSPLCMKHD
ncbi:ladderlectin-like isoform X2 [Penaeus chinensis]|uniref:ladderlectin-like isoform X2 n=1 Tax=Penaeus chinensis TaxID=139456 RepID=UPI001FB64117|nr:ladderlectin-like isoform X2 [Penaeus chinensis]